MSDGITPGKPIRIYQDDGGFSDFSTEEVVGRKLNKFSGWRCAAGVENLCINFDGDVLSASCGSIGSSATNGKYGNVFEDFTLEQDWITCPQEFCSCGADLFIPKVKSEKDLPHLKFKNGNAHQLEKRTPYLKDAVALERTFRGRSKQVFWELGRRCNFDCSYCHPYVHNNYEEHKSLEMLKFAVEKLERFSKGEKINFAISGGEPTVNPHFLEWVKFLTSKGHTVSTHSNGSRLPEYYLDLIKHSDINISVHFEFYQREKLLEVLTALAHEINNRKNTGEVVGHLEVMLMVLPGNSEQSSAFEKEIWEIPFFTRNCTLTAMPIRGHESIEKKEEKTGDVLLKEYKTEELAEFGNKTLEQFISSEPKECDDIFYDYDILDEMSDVNQRKNTFSVLEKDITEKMKAI